MSKQKKKTERQDAPLVLKKRMPERKRFWYVLWNLFLMLLACGALTYFTLRLSYSNLNPDIWLGYWEDLWIPAMNLALIFGLCLVLFALTGRAWLAFLLTALVALAIAIGNYYLIIIRSDALQFQDVVCLPEALAITGTQHYELELTPLILSAVASALGFTGLLAVLSRWKPRWGLPRVMGIVLALAVMTGFLAAGNTFMVDLTKHYEHVNTWSVTEIYVSRGVIYSFTRTIFSASGRPSGYSAKKTEALLSAYASEDIPADRKADVFVVMRESYADLSELDCVEEAIDFSCYDLYHALKSESVLWGNLVTNGFGGNTKDAERCFLTGNYSTKDWRRPVNSYLWYLKEQGYRTEGAHPFNGWFYNRLNVNRYLGFDDYRFREDGFDALVGAENIADDDVLYDVIWTQYTDYLQENDGPYFNFSVTYEGHGPYSYSNNSYAGRYVLLDAYMPDGLALNNYLGCCERRDRELAVLTERFRASERPIVLLVYGDHKATLGKDINNYTTSAYSHFGMDVDLSTEEGFFNYYSTDYVIWMNDAARALLGVTGDEPELGPTVSPCYLMNVLFDTLGWGKGPAYLQAMEEMMDAFPVYSTKGRVSIEGKLSSSIPGAWVEKYHQMQALSYYWQTNFLYDELK